MKMSAKAIVLLATFTAANLSRVRLDKAEGLLDAIDAHTVEHEAISAVDVSVAASTVAPSDLARAIAALEAAVDQSDACRALGDPDLVMSVVRLDTVRAKLANLVGDTLAKRTELYDAAGSGQVKVVKDLVKHGVNVNSKARPTLLHTDGIGTPLQHAAKEGYPETVRELLEAGAEKDTPDEQGKTPLWYAAQGKWRDSLGVMRVLLEAKANTELGDKRGLTPLHVAAGLDRDAAVHLLLDAGANKDAKLVDTGETPLFVAALRGSTKVARTLINAGAVSCLSNSVGDKPITVAKNEEIRKMLEAVQQSDC